MRSNEQVSDETAPLRALFDVSFRRCDASDGVQATPDYRFGPFRVDLRTGILWRGEEPVGLTPKASELLVLLVREGERGLTKTELLERLWPDTVVLENNLTVAISALRKALVESAAAPHHVQTLPRRVYRFVPGAPDAGVRSSPPEARTPSFASAEVRPFAASTGPVEASPSRTSRTRSCVTAVPNVQVAVFRAVLYEKPEKPSPPPRTPVATRSLTSTETSRLNSTATFVTRHGAVRVARSAASAHLSLPYP
jgi:DNA-binding winged helix-turn-helix (wHTH) protein